MKGRLYSVVFFVALTLALVLVNGDHASASIPRIGGTWTIRGEGTWGDIAVTDDGVSIITTYIDTDGYEVIIEYSYSGVIRDGAGNVLLRDSYTLNRQDLGGGIKVTSREAVIADYRITIISETRINARRTGRVEGRPVDADYVLTRDTPPDPGAGSSGGGCSVGHLPLSSIVLLLPLLILLVKRGS